MEKLIEYTKIVLKFYTKITTAVFFCAMIYIMIFWGTDYEIEIIWVGQILFVSALCALGIVIHPCDDEEGYSKKSFFLRQLLYYLYVNAVVMTCGYLFHWYYAENWKMVLGMEAVILAVFVIVTLTTYLIEYKEAQKMNKKLRERSKPKTGSLI